MTALTFQLDSTKAREGSGSTGFRIDKSGEYHGTINQARFTENDKGTKGVEIHFEEKNGGNAYFTLWVQNGQGEAIYGEKVLHALMTCLKVRELKPVLGKASVYQDGQVQDIAADIYPDLMGKPIGMLFQAEEYQGQNGKKMRINLKMPFDIHTRQCAQEILDKQDAATVDKIAPTLKDKMLAANGGAASFYASAGGQATPPQGADYADFDDDIPF